MAARMLRQTRWTILLALNAIAIIVAGVLIARALGWNGLGSNVVSEKTDVSDEAVEELALLESATATTSGKGEAATALSTTYVNNSSGGISQDAVPAGQLWNESAVTMYETADFDICVGGSLTGLGDMYWQTSNTEVISGFYASARTWLGYSSATCKYPIVKGVGTTTVTAGTYDGNRRDTLTVTVIAAPADQWQREVLDLVNQERAKAGLAALSWGSTCEVAAKTRAQELITKYSHTRPSGSEWSTACPIPASGGVSGENLAAGNAAVTPETVVAAWMNSEEHRKNILSTEFTKLAVGFVYDADSQYKTYWAQYFSNY